MAEIILKDYEDEWGYQYVIGMGRNSGEAIVSQIEALLGQETTLRISSVGGSCYAALEIVAAIKKHGNVKAQIDGVAFSAAAFISAACKSVYATKYTMMMIHNSRINADMWGTFTAEDLRKLAEETGAQLDAFDKMQADVFAEKTGLPLNQVEEMLSETTWMTGTEANELGFIDTLTDIEATAISRSLFDNAFAKAPMLMVAMANKNLKVTENNSNMSEITELRAQHEENKSLFAQLKDFLGIKAQADKPEETVTETETKEVVTEKPAEEVPAKSAEELEKENEDLKTKLADAEAKASEGAQALLDAKAMMSETKTLLAEVRSNYKPAAKGDDFDKSTPTNEAGSKFIKPTKNK